MQERKEYTGDSVYERAQKFLNDASRGGTNTSNNNTNLAEKVGATKYLKKLRDNESITRDDEARKAQLELMQAMESGNINPTNYLDGGVYRTGQVSFGGINKGNLTYNKFDNQKGFYKMVGDKASETVVLFPNITTIGTPGIQMYERPSGIASSNKTSFYEYGMRKEGGIVTNGKYDTSTGELIEGVKNWKDGTKEIGTWDKNGKNFTGKQTYNGRTIAFDNGKVINSGSQTT